MAHPRISAKIKMENFFSLAKKPTTGVQKFCTFLMEEKKKNLNSCWLQFFDSCFCFWTIILHEGKKTQMVSFSTAADPTLSISAVKTDRSEISDEKFGGRGSEKQLWWTRHFIQPFFASLAQLFSCQGVWVHVFNIAKLGSPGIASLLEKQWTPTLTKCKSPRFALPYTKVVSCRPLNIPMVLDAS